MILVRPQWNWNMPNESHQYADTRNGLVGAFLDLVIPPGLHDAAQHRGGQMPKTREVRKRAEVPLGLISD